MSSMPSPETIAEAALPAAVVHVAEQSFFAYAEPCRASDVEDLMPADGRWLRSAVRFQGGHRWGSLAIVMPHALARDLTAGFGGCDVMELTDAMVIDATGELCNMICGLWLTRANPHTTFALSAPEVTGCDAPNLHIEGSSFLLINDMPVVVSVEQLERA